MRVLRSRKNQLRANRKTKNYVGIVVLAECILKTLSPKSQLRLTVVATNCGLCAFIVCIPSSSECQLINNFNFFLLLFITNFLLQFLAIVRWVVAIVKKNYVQPNIRYRILCSVVAHYTKLTVWRHTFFCCLFVWCNQTLASIISWIRQMNMNKNDKKKTVIHLRKLRWPDKLIVCSATKV